MTRFLFPKTTNLLRPVLILLSVAVPVYAVAFVWYCFSPVTIDKGYAPAQPIPYSHALHAGELGIDCRYCHSTVEATGKASIPPTQVCMNCHQTVRSQSPKLAELRKSYSTGEPVEWVRVHDLPDYVYFNHSAHVTRGVGCSSCHGRVDKMETVTQVAPLSMAWCLDCHRNPSQNIRPKDQVTRMDWQPADAASQNTLVNHYGTKPSTDCSTCHR
ncbi:cytochrome c3 family protein [Candidatus Sumerlaeota bacterium]|nr:cytochrome c3 family protein [Candidatus Sumerlaeota bacterium]